VTLAVNAKKEMVCTPYYTCSTSIYKGHIVDTPSLAQYRIVENGYIIVEGSKVKGVYSTVPEEYKSIFVVDYGNKLIIPGFVDLHFHASQLANRGLELDRELLFWLTDHTFREEARFEDLSYAAAVYEETVRQMIKNGTTRASLLATIHKDSTLILMDIASRSGLRGFVGKVNMDINTPEYLTENTWQSLRDTEEILIRTSGRNRTIQPIVTPRFAPACSIELMKALGILARKYDVPVQSHLSEDLEELEFVRELYPQFKNYASIYDEFGLFGQQPTIMAHCVYLTEEEMALMERNQVYVAHCPVANLNLSGSIAPIRRYLEMGIPVGLGTDVGAGHLVSIKDVMWQAIQSSKVLALKLQDERYKLTTPEVFYLATKGGGSFFGKVGSFEEGYDFDALVIDDSSLFSVKPLTIEERIARFVYIGDSRNIFDRFIAGNKIYVI
jgi:guanine deaminase